MRIKVKSRIWTTLPTFQVRGGGWGGGGRMAEKDCVKTFFIDL